MRMTPLFGDFIRNIVNNNHAIKSIKATAIRMASAT
jgi:hypothetical protein